MKTSENESLYNHNFIIMASLTITMYIANNFLKEHHIPKQNQVNFVQSYKMLATTAKHLKKNVGTFDWTTISDTILNYSKIAYQLTALPFTNHDQNSIRFIEQIEKTSSVNSLFDESYDFIEELHRFASDNYVTVIINPLLFNTIKNLNNRIYALVAIITDQNHPINPDQSLPDLKQIVDSTNYLLGTGPFDIAELDF